MVGASFFPLSTKTLDRAMQDGAYIRLAQPCDRSDSAVVQVGSVFQRDKFPLAIWHSGQEHSQPLEVGSSQNLIFRSSRIRIVTDLVQRHELPAATKVVRCHISGNSEKPGGESSQITTVTIPGAPSLCKRNGGQVLCYGTVSHPVAKEVVDPRELLSIERIPIDLCRRSYYPDQPFHH